MEINLISLVRLQGMDSKLKASWGALQEILLSRAFPLTMQLASRNLASKDFSMSDPQQQEISWLEKDKDFTSWLEVEADEGAIRVKRWSSCTNTWKSIRERKEKAHTKEMKETCNIN